VSHLPLLIDTLQLISSISVYLQVWAFHDHW